MAQDSRLETAPVASFDHVYAVVDAVTAEEIARSDYLRDFGRFLVRTTRADGETWTGRYLFGRRTYVEVFGPTDLDEADSAEGATGIGLSTPHRGVLAELVAHIEREGGSVETGRRSRREGDRDIEWFDHLSPSRESETLAIWVMEFLGDPGDLEVRDSAFATWAEEAVKAEPDRRSPVLGEVCSVELDAVIDDIAAAEPLLRAAGFDVTRRDDTWSARDPHTTITLNARPVDAVGLRRIEFTLGSPATSVHVEPLGRSTLTVGPGSRAVWEFGP